MRGLGVALIVGGVALGLYVAAMALFGGCGAPALPPEPPFVETVAASARDH